MHIGTQYYIALIVQQCNAYHIPDVWSVVRDMEFGARVKIFAVPGDRRWNTLNAASANHILRY